MRLAVAFRGLRLERRQVGGGGLERDAGQRVLARGREHHHLCSSDARKILEAIAPLRRGEIRLDDVHVRARLGGCGPDVLKRIGRQIAVGSAQRSRCSRRGREAGRKEDHRRRSTRAGKAREQAPQRFERFASAARGVGLITLPSRIIGGDRSSDAGDFRERLTDRGGRRRIGADRGKRRRQDRDAIGRRDGVQVLVDRLLHQPLVPRPERPIVDHEERRAAAAVRAGTLVPNGAGSGGRTASRHRPKRRSPRQPDRET